MDFDTFETIFWSIVFLIGIGFAFFLVLSFVSFCKRETQFRMAEPIRVEARLLSYDYSPSTRSTHSAPVFNGKGQMSAAVYSTGHDESHTTIWDCGCYGRLISTSRRIYRFARDRSILILKQVGEEARIWDIDNTVIL